MNRHFETPQGLSADERLEFHVVEAGDGQQCLQATASTWPDVVVLDLKMPILDGIAAAKRIEEEWPQIRVVMLTSSDSSTDRKGPSRLASRHFRKEEDRRSRASAADRC